VAQVRRGEVVQVGDEQAAARAGRQDVAGVVDDFDDQVIGVDVQRGAVR